MLYTVIENIALRSWQIFCSFVLSVRNEYPRVSTGYYFPPVIEMYTNFDKFARLYFLYFRTFRNQTCEHAILLSLGYSFKVWQYFCLFRIFFKILSKRLKLHCNCILKCINLFNFGLKTDTFNSFLVRPSVRPNF